MYRTDPNQAEIVRALRAAGCCVWSAAHVGGGFPDLVVGRIVAGERRTYLLEVKRPDGPPSTRRLNAREQAWHSNWWGHVAVVHTAEEAFEAVGLRTVVGSAA